MSRRMIAMVASGVVIAAGAITLAVMTRSTAEPLKSTEGARKIESPATLGTSTTESPRNSVTATTPVSDDGQPSADVAGDGNGSAGARLERLADEYGQHHWADAMAQCLSPEVAIAGAKACAISACELHDAMHARMYYSRVGGADRSEVLVACEQAHVRLEHAHRPFFGPHHRPFRSPSGSGG